MSVQMHLRLDEEVVAYIDGICERFPGFNRNMALSVMVAKCKDWDKAAEERFNGMVVKKGDGFVMIKSCDTCSNGCRSCDNYKDSNPCECIKPTCLTCFTKKDQYINFKSIKED